MLTADQVLHLVRDRVDHPATLDELLRRLRIPPEQRHAFRRHVRALVASGDLIQTRGGRYGVRDRMNLVVGRVEAHPAGYGFVVPERPVEDLIGDIFIAGTNLNQAMHGDRVVARIERHQGDGRAEGRIVRILDRRASQLVGRYDLDETGVGFVTPFDRRDPTDVHVPRGEGEGAASGDMVVVELIRFPTATRNAVGRVVEVLGDVNRPGVDTQIIIRKHALPDRHDAAAVAEAAQLGPRVRDADRHGRTDFRGLVTVTIDGDHARDFDDAITIERQADGHYRLGVHIADVAHYVREGTALDREAYARGTSVYFPERAVHMFPEGLATGLCSLNPGVDRLVQSCVMEVDRQGEVVRYGLHDGIIHSDERMTYTAVNAILSDREPAATARYAALVPMFETMRELFLILNERRQRRGSIDFDLRESEVVLGEEGLIEAIVPSERNVAHRLIEEFMLLANETIAAHLERSGLPALYRVHEPPDPLKVEDFEEFVSALGYSLAAPPGSLRPRHFQRLVERIRGTPEEKPIAMLLLRTMQKARYDATNLGHFGLAAPAYTHFTSPIRRYPDLVVHRIVRAQRQPRPNRARLETLAAELAEIARHTSERERRADEAERELVQWKKVRFMADKVGDEFDGYITGVAAFGLFIELIEHFVEGMVHVSTMADDYYRFIEKAHVLRGENTNKVYRLGDRVRVQVLRVDQEHRRIDLGLAEILDRVRASERPRGSRTGSVTSPAARRPASRSRRPPPSGAMPRRRGKTRRRR